MYYEVTKDREWQEAFVKYRRRNTRYTEPKKGWSYSQRSACIGPICQAQ